MLTESIVVGVELTVLVVIDVVSTLSIVVEVLPTVLVVVGAVLIVLVVVGVVPTVSVVVGVVLAILAVVVVFEILVPLCIKLCKFENVCDGIAVVPPCADEPAGEVFEVTSRVAKADDLLE